MLTHSKIVIIGSGFSGLGMAIRLKQNHIEDFKIFERASDVGGVWRDNSYPGCGCDVESHLYSFSFAPNPNWSRMFSLQGEIWHYLQNCAEKFKLRPHILFHHEFKQGRWNGEKKVWEIETSQGVYTADILISGTGAFSEPAIPDIPGLQDFRGEVFHSAKWNHHYDLKNKKVAVIGTGASAIQFIPKVQPMVENLILFQRTPPWVLPRIDRSYTEKEKIRFKRFPFIQKIGRLRFFIIREFFGLTFRVPKYIGYAKGMALHHMKKKISDPELIKKLTPNYIIGCKRVLLSNDYYPALAQPNVQVVTDKIVKLNTHSIVDNTGKEHEIDAVILGTGFKVTDFIVASCVYGKNGKSLREVWEDSPKAYLGTTVSEFPNFFFLLGPNTGLGHTSVILMIEAQIELVLASILFIQKKNISVFEVRPESEKKFVDHVDKASQKTVWVSGGCKSWYLDKTGRNSTLWPGSIRAFQKTILPFKSRDYFFTESTK